MEFKIEQDVVYVLDKEMNHIAEFKVDDEDTIINPRVTETQNAEAIFTFSIAKNNPKWKQINNPENLYVLNDKMFSTNFEECFTETLTEEDENLISVKAYEIQKLLSRKYVRAWNSTTGLERIDSFMVVILSKGSLELFNNDQKVNSKHPKGSSGYVLDGLLYGTGWKTGTCDVEGTYDFETDQTDIYTNIMKIQEIWGGILVFDSLNKIVHHRDETKYLPYNGYEVKYQKNMQSLEQIYNNKIITKLCPLGEGGLNIKKVNNGSLWLTNYSYTNSVLEGIVNNPDITEQDQLRRWGERKLQDLCKPRKELTVQAVLLYQLKGYELEEIGLNHIVDVINYAEREGIIEQLRVVGYDYGIWDKSDAILDLSDITLESTDIFKKAVVATNQINNGTLNSNKVVIFYKNGQSLSETLYHIDETIVNTKSELTKADDEIRASVSQVISGVDTLKGEVATQKEITTELKAEVGKFSTTVTEVETIKKGAVFSSIDEFYLSDSATELKGGTWSKEQPIWQEGKYIWRRSLVTKGDGVGTYQPSEKGVCITGNTGPAGKDGAAGQNGLPGKDGANGKDGKDGTSVSILSTSVEYKISDSGSEIPISGWQKDLPTIPSGKYLWTKTEVAYSNNKKTTTYSVSYAGTNGTNGINGQPGKQGPIGPQGPAGAKGETGAAGKDGAPGKQGPQGEPGKNGTNGRSVTSIVEMYYKSTSATQLLGGIWSTTYPGWENGKYIWTKSVINYSTGNPDETKPICVSGSKGTDGKNGTNGTNGAPGKDGANGTNGANGISVTSVDVWYYLSTSATSLAGGTWSTNAPVWTQGKYMWSKTITTYSKGSPTESKPVCISGSKGDTGKAGQNGQPGKDGQNGAPGKDGAPGKNGNPGKDGKGIKSTAVTYQIWNNGTSVPTGNWSSTPPKTTADKPFLWTRTIITYTDNTSSTSYSVGSTIEGVQVGGRNLLWNTNFSKPLDNKYGVRGDIYKLSTNIIDNKSCLVVSASDSGLVGTDITMNLTIGNCEPKTEYIFSGLAKGVKDSRLFARFGYGETTNSVAISDKWERFEILVKSGNQTFFQLLPYFNKAGTYYLSQIKLEKGNKATDWTPAPEDVQGEIDNVENTQAGMQDRFEEKFENTNQLVAKAQSDITQLSNMISHLVTDANGQSLMTQTSDGWTFNMGAINGNLDAVKKGITDLQNKDGTHDSEIKNITDLLNNVTDKTAYITMTTDDSGQPCIELGKVDSKFKVRITNTAIDFLEGSSKMAYANNNTFYSKKVVTNQLQIGNGPGFVWKIRENGNMGLTYIS